MYQNLLEIYGLNGRRLVRYKPDAVITKPVHALTDSDIYGVEGIIMTFEIEYDDVQEPT